MVHCEDAAAGSVQHCTRPNVAAHEPFHHAWCAGVRKHLENNSSAQDLPASIPGHARNVRTLSCRCWLSGVVRSLMPVILSWAGPVGEGWEALPSIRLKDVHLKPKIRHDSTFIPAKSPQKVLSDKTCALQTLQQHTNRSGPVSSSHVSSPLFFLPLFPLPLHHSMFLSPPCTPLPPNALNPHALNPRP